MKIVLVEKIADTSSGKNDMPPHSKQTPTTKIREYIKNGTGMKSMNKTAKNTPTAYDLFWWYYGTINLSNPFHISLWLL